MARARTLLAAGFALLALLPAAGCVRNTVAKPAGTGGGSGTGAGGPCDSDQDCRAAGQLCDAGRSVCVQCLQSTQCPANHDCRAGACVPFSTCANSLDCAAGQVCARDVGRCVDCVVAADCAAGQLCQANTCRQGCVSDRDCVAAGRLCDLGLGACVACIVDVDCPGGYCSASACLPRVCAPAQRACAGDAVSTCNPRGDGWSSPAACAEGACQEAGGSVTCVRPSGSGGGGGAVSGSGGSGATGGSAVVPCPAGQETTISGVVYDPAGARPLYGVSVYVPGGALAPLPQGAASCDRCGAALSGQPLAAAETDATGRFVLRNVPAGSGVPLVMQTGKWRRQVAIPSVVACADNAVSDRNLTRLPRNRTEGDLPRIAVSTGGSDAFECLLRRIGVSDSEFTTDVGAGRVHLYVGGPAGSTEGPGTTSFAPELGGARLPHATTLWSNPAKLLGYDMLLLSCEGSSYASEKSPYLANIAAYADAGGRVLAGHNQFVWITNGSAAYQQTADYIGVGEDLPQPATVLVDTTFPKGAAFADWLLVVGASAIRGELVIYQGQYSVAAVTPPTRRWLHLPAHPVETTPVTTYLTFDTPPGAPPANQCGRFALVDMHLNTRTPEGGGGDRSEPDVPFPTGCAATPMTPQLTAMEFLLFDLGSCL